MNNSHTWDYQNMGFDSVQNLYDSEGNQLTSNVSRTMVINTPDKRAWVYAGTFIASGTEAYFCVVNTTDKDWKISNISFSSGDIYSFEVEVSLSGN